jgi:hypothetical protein
MPSQFADIDSQLQKTQFVPSEVSREPTIVGLDIRSGQALSVTTSKEPYAFPIMLRRAAYNKKFCEVIINNLQFLKPEIMTIVKTSPIHSTILYDGRTDAELRVIRRPAQLSQDDCEELVTNYDYDVTSALAARLGIRIDPRHGPWFVVVDPNDRSAAVIDFVGRPDKFQEGIDQAIEILHDSELWRNRPFDFRKFFLRFSDPPIRLIRLPSNFPR